MLLLSDHTLLRRLARARRLHSLGVEIKDPISILACTAGAYCMKQRGGEGLQLIERLGIPCVRWYSWLDLAWTINVHAANMCASPSRRYGWPDDEFAYRWPDDNFAYRWPDPGWDATSRSVRCVRTPTSIGGHWRPVGIYVHWVGYKCALVFLASP